MSGLMKYLYRECKDCDHFDWDESDMVVNSVADMCEKIDTEDCPGKHFFDCFEDDGNCNCQDWAEWQEEVEHDD